MAKRTYRVTGEQPVAGHQPGDEFQHDFGDQEDVLITAGSIELVKKPGDKPADKPKEG